jgi:hypothetical protein
MILRHQVFTRAEQQSSLHFLRQGREESDVILTDGKIFLGCSPDAVEEDPRPFGKAGV